MFGEPFDWTEVLSHLYHLAIAYILAVPIGWDREMRTRSAGLRTFPLVAIGACGYMLTGISVVESEESRARVMYGVLTGIGFIGGGAILKEQGSVMGTATAASIWNTGAMGLSVAWGHYEIAMVLSLLNFLTLRYVAIFKEKLSKSEAK